VTCSPLIGWWWADTTTGTTTTTDTTTDTDTDTNTLPTHHQSSPMPTPTTTDTDTNAAPIEPPPDIEAAAWRYSSDSIERAWRTTAGPPLIEAGEPLTIPAAMVRALAVDGGSITITLTKAPPPATAAALERSELLRGRDDKAAAARAAAQHHHLTQRVEELAAGFQQTKNDIYTITSNNGADLGRVEGMLAPCGHIDDYSNPCGNARFEGMMGRCGTPKCPHRPPAATPTT
jgi:hypothetical protein